MVMGLKTKPQKSLTVHLDYIIHIQEIKPWPPSQSLRTLRAVLIQWNHGERTSGSTNQAVPSLGTGSGVGDGRIEFSETFRLPVILTREMSIKGRGGDTFHKNCIEFNLYEPRRDKTVKGQLLGTAVLDFADYGIVKDSLSINVPINCKRNYGNIAQPFLVLKIRPVEKVRMSSSSRGSLIREASMDRNHGKSVSSFMSEEYAEEAEIGSFATDDDVSSHSSLTITSPATDSNGRSSPQNKANGTAAMNSSAVEAKVEQVPNKCAAKPHGKRLNGSHLNLARHSSRSSAVDLSSDLEWISKKFRSQSLLPSAIEGDKQSTSKTKRNEDEVMKNIWENLVNGGIVKSACSEEGKLTTSISDSLLETNQLGQEDLFPVHSHQQDERNVPYPPRQDLADTRRTNSHHNGSLDDEAEEHPEYEEERKIMEENGRQEMDEPLDVFSGIDVEKQVITENDAHSAVAEMFEANSHYSNNDRPRHGKSVRSSTNSIRNNGLVRNNQFFVADSQNEDSKMHAKETRNAIGDSRILRLERRIELLEGELMEAGALEVSLYSVVAEHGSSTNKVHAPARRLSRLYFNAGKQNVRSRRAGVAKSVLSGLVLVAKACGNDVPRLTFWLSNAIVLRAIISETSSDITSSISLGPPAGNIGGADGKKPSLLKWESVSSKSTQAAMEQSLGDWESPLTFAAGLEKVEAWIFSQIVESLWWQTFTPRMQCGAATAIHRSADSATIKLLTSSSTDQQRNFSLELWRKALADACERICPLRAGGHDCGCLAMISGQIMEQLIARLDVAMFNAILRESADEIPTDPVSDPISDAEVLPIPPGRASFGAGAQLKNAIGNWSRWLSDLLGFDDDGMPENENSSEATDDDERLSCQTSSKAFHLLNALSDLMMLPKDMILSRTIRKEVCPTFGPPLIRRVLNSFVPDEFCPDPIPRVVIEALNSEDTFDSEEEYIMIFPCAASSITYQAPSAASVDSVFGDISIHPQLTRNESSILKKSQTIDDELEELNSALKFIALDSSRAPFSSESLRWPSKENGSQKAVRYQLLQEVWVTNV